MSEYINNREYRQKVLKELIMELHDGKSVEEVKERFSKLIEGISATEISEMENTLIKEGMPVSEVQRLCDVHAAVFKGSIEEIHQPTNQEEIIGHPVHTFKLENRAIERLINKTIKPIVNNLKNGDDAKLRAQLSEAFAKLWEIDKHYLRKENLLFPFMEKYQITAPPKVMWGVDDEIRDALKEIRSQLANSDTNMDSIIANIEATTDRILEMIFKEESILFPMVLETLAEDEWLKIAQESAELGFCLYEPMKEWKPVRVNVEEKVLKQGEEPAGDGYLTFETGILAKHEIEGLLNTLPVDITFVDKEGVVKFFTQGKERIFPRTKAVIGRKVGNCHPPASVHIVEKIVEDLMSGVKDHEDFWIHMGDKYVLIRYFAIRDKEGNYVGTLEFTQDIGPIQMIEGERRLVSEDK
ncbi:MAG TPA: DUF438 domain-containing protein [Mobilitalea sp.]|nr:DUF438 domain-containing protein [Mobilitalea sp.]